MKNTFTKSQNLILIILVLIGATFLAIPIINHSDRCLMPTIAVISWFIFGMYRNYLRNKRFIGKDSKIFLLYNRRTTNIFNIVINLFLIVLAIVVISLYKFSYFGLFLLICIIFYNSLSWLLFTYQNDTLIMVNNTCIYSHETGFIKLEQIKKYSKNTDLMSLNFELKNDEKKSIEYNKFIDIELLDKELQMKLSRLKNDE